MNRELSKKLEEFIMISCRADLERILLELKLDSPYGLSIRVLELFDFDPDLGEECLMNPVKYLRTFVEAIHQCQARLIGLNPFPERMKEKDIIIPRLSCLPITPWTYYERIPTIHSLRKLVSFRGTVVRTGGLKLQEYSKEWECSKCKTRQFTFVDDHQYGTIPKPMFCNGAINGSTCKNGKFQELRDQDAPSTYYDYQEIKIQELTSVLSIGAVPRSILVILRHDLVDRCRAGEDVIITGVHCSRFKPNPKPDQTRMNGEFFIQATSIQSATSTIDSNSPAIDEEQVKEEFEQFWSHPNQDEITLNRSLIVNSFCPHLHGMFLVKLATLLTVIGGSDLRSGEERDNDPFEESTGVRQNRREGHLLLLGDPGTGKSQFLVQAAKLINRSVITTGSGTTTAGLTCSAVKDGSDWQLEAGALVMADRGICCIDEFTALKPHDRTAIHEAMEQQTLSVAKAGLVCKLNTRCSIIAACNAKGIVEDGRALSSSMALGSPLLSRFDLILVLLDGKRGGVSWDSELCDRLLGIKVDDPSGSKWTLNELKTYVNYVRTQINPKMTPVAEEVLAKYYQLQRRCDKINGCRTTVRLLESLIRLSQAHAKLMFHTDVMLVDAITAVILIEASLTSTQTVRTPIDLYAKEMSAAEYTKWYETIETEILSKLEISKEREREIEDITSDSEVSLSDMEVNLSPQYAKVISRVASMTQI